MTWSPDLTDEQINQICKGLKQNAAKVRYLRTVLKLKVERRPDGSPLVATAEWERRFGPLQPQAKTSKATPGLRTASNDDDDGPSWRVAA